MLEIFIAELRRYRTAALLFAGFGLVLSYLLFRTSNFLDTTYLLQAQCFIAYTLSGMALAVFQFGSYRKPARWLWLLHRPLPRLHIFMAVHLAAAALIVLAAGVPLELSLLATKAEHARVVDVRHFIGALHITLFGILGWQCASYAMLARHRGASVVLIFPLMLAGLYFASAYVLLVPAMLCLLLMGCALSTVFRPERHSSAKLQPRSVAMAAVPVMLCIYYILVWGSTTAFEIGLTASGRSKPPHQVPGGLLESMSATSHQGMVVAELARSADSRAPSWSKQIPPLSESILFPHMRHHPVRHAVSNAGYSAFLTGKNSWTFSHDRLHFLARDNRLDTMTDAFLGPHGEGDATPFTQPAVSVYPSKTESLMYTRQMLTLLDNKSMVAQHLVTFTGDEVIASVPEVEVESNSLRIITNRRFMEYAWPVVGGALKERFNIVLPGLLSDLRSVAIAKVDDGTLVTMQFGRQQEYGMTTSPIATYLVQGDKVTTIHQRTLVLDFGFLYTQRFYWMSPSLFALFEVPRVLIDTGRVLDAGLTLDTMKLSIERPVPAHALALALLLASALAAWLRLRREDVSPRYRAWWIAACLVFGLPALFALMLLQGKLATRRVTSTTGALEYAA